MSNPNQIAPEENHISRSLLRECFEDLLFFEYPGKQRAAAERLFAALSQITNVNDRNSNCASRQQTILSSGKAISPLDAARCTLDYFRTAKFIQGILLALHQVKQHAGSRPVEVLYAGCGPFAPFALAIADRFSAEQVQLTLLDVHQLSIDAAQQVLKYFGLEDRVKAYVCGDAVKYRHPQFLDLVITETMQRALTKEPHVEVTMNLVPQLSAHGILIPERVRVDIQLAKLGDEFSDGCESGRKRIALGTIFDLTPDLCRRALDSPELITKPRVIEVPNGATAEHRPILATYVKVFGDAELKDYDSGISYPTVLENLDGLHPGDRLEFRYQLGPNPGFLYRVLDPAESRVEITSERVVESARSSP